MWCKDSHLCLKITVYHVLRRWVDMVRGVRDTQNILAGRAGWWDMCVFSTDMGLDWIDIHVPARNNCRSKLSLLLYSLSLYREIYIIVCVQFIKKPHERCTLHIWSLTASNDANINNCMQSMYTCNAVPVAGVRLNGIDCKDRENYVVCIDRHVCWNSKHRLPFIVCWPRNKLLFFVSICSKQTEV